MRRDIGKFDNRRGQMGMRLAYCRTQRAGAACDIENAMNAAEIQMLQQGFAARNGLGGKTAQHSYCARRIAITEIQCRCRAVVSNRGRRFKARAPALGIGGGR